VDEDNTAATRYRVKGLPTLVIIDPQGITRNRHVGLTSKEELLADISALTGRSARDL
jgi:hypothetical protein